nr:pitrilysin family protein [Veronia pacifica]
MDNGLTVLLHKDSSDPLVHVDVTYHVGSAREEPGRSGFAHFFEHMMFQGSEHVADQQHFAIVTESGGSLNGSTNRDRTNYYQTVPSNQLEKILWLEADRMGFFIDAMSQRKFDIQLDTVKNERAQNYDNRPYGLVSEKIAETLYPPGHPYAHPTIGYVRDLNRATLDDLKAFFLRWYGPNNATLTIGGDFDTAQTLAWIKKYFADIPTGPEVEPQAPAPVALTESRYLTLEDKIEQPVLTLTWPTVTPSSKVRISLDMLTAILGGGKNGLLYQKLVKPGKVLSASVSQRCGELACSVQLYVSANKGQPLSDVYNDVMDVLEHFNERGASEDDLSLVKGGAEASAIFSLQSVQGKVAQLAFNQTFYDTPDRLNTWLKRLAKVSTRDVDTAFDSYIWQKPAVVLSTVPEGMRQLAAATANVDAVIAVEPTEREPLKVRKTPETFDRSKMPTAGEPVFGALPDVYRFALDNGVQVIGMESRETPTILLEFLLPAGSLIEPDGKQGVAYLTAAMLEEGTQSSSGEEIEAKLDRLGSSVNLWSGREHTILSVSTLKKNLYPTLKIAAEILYQPRFSEQDFTRLKRQTIESLGFQSSSPRALLIKAQREVLYKNDQHRTPPGGDRKTISALTLDDVKQFYQQHYSPSGTQVAIVGDITQRHAQSLISRLSQWQGEPARPSALPDYNQYQRQTIWLVDKPGATQSTIQFVRKGMPYDVTGDMFKTMLANFNLGGNFNGRLNQNLREDKGFTYGVRGSVYGNKDSGLIAFETQVRADVTADAIQEMRRELDLFATKGLSEQEMAFMRSAFVQGQALSYETPAQKIALLEAMQEFGLPASYRQQQQKIIASVTKKELNKLAKQWFNPSDYQIILVGDAKKIRASLEKTGLPIEMVATES